MVMPPSSSSLQRTSYGIDIHRSRRNDDDTKMKKLALSIVVLPHLARALSNAVPSTTLETRAQPVRVTSSVTGQSAAKASTTTETSSSSCRGPWEKRFQDLLDFQKEHGHCRVPKRYEPNRRLANWVSKQRQEHRKFINGEKASITADRIEALEGIGFCWNAQMDSLVLSRNDPNISPRVDLVAEEWKGRLQSLVDFMSENNLTSVAELPLHSSHDIWIKHQRTKYKNAPTDRKRKSLDPEQWDLLHQIDPLWHLNRHELVWETRFQELVAYASKHGNCCVPISYPNKKLAHWVSNQRKLHSDQLKGRHNSLNDQRKRRLEKIGFVWNRWDYEFGRKNVREGSFLKT